ncbi:hypothetical protein HG530_013991 [Fusarium avenaceum]|nr:hypothetical protein HG530_013991 [Fusarium avenaceum]
MSERKLDHLSNLSHLLSASTDVIVANLVEVVLLLVSLNGFALAVDDGILCDDTILRGVDLDNLEFYLVDGDHVTMLDSEVVANNSVDASAAIIELIIGKNDENSILSLLASNQDGVTSEELELVHGGLGESNDAVVIVDGITQNTYISWLGFFFFLRIAVATSSSCEKVSYLVDGLKRSDITNGLDLGAGRVAV